MIRQVLVHQGIQKIAVLEEPCPEPGPGEVLVKTRLGGISAGTEVMIYRGLFPESVPLDENLPALQGSFSYPFRYGYCCVGEIMQCGPEVPSFWLGRRVFSFHPHASHFTVPLESVILIPETLRDEDAVFIPNMETAVNLVQDGRPLLGESVLVFGLGVVGLLTLTLLTRFPLGFLGALDLFPERRERALSLGASGVFNAAESQQPPSFRHALEAAGCSETGADLVFELSGKPETLNQAIGLCGFSGRIIVGSWYGTKTAPIALGGEYHRNRISISSSQVSSIDPSLSGRWNKQRRFGQVLKQLETIRPGDWISHYYPLCQADEVFQRLANSPEGILQAVFTYA
jgi:2-desacetyl-2-hydroxyethyl bacteriochlorophyllide A dehydrogenase